ncbi:MAG: 30S ribosomal protein S3 [Candidatus Micrarchaeota archaeon]|nr:30S ribosomal protein S3 [Candidatus Micrarchaeota archaeon]
MAIERKFVEDAVTRYQIANFLREKLERYGFSNVTIQRTPMVTRITIEVANPGRLIGKKGKSIKALAEKIEKEFGVKDPQIAVVPVEKIELEPRLVAYAIAKNIEAGKPLRALIHSSLKKIIDAGALGAEIVVGGKIAAKGAKAKSMRVAWGYLPKAGDVVKQVKKAQVTARPKYGAINVRVSIAPPDAIFPDKLSKVDVPNLIKYSEEEERQEMTTKEEKKELKMEQMQQKKQALQQKKKR